MLYYDRETIMFSVLEYIIYNIVDNFICLDYMCLIQNKLSKHNKSLEKQGIMIFLGGDTENLNNLLSCHGFSKLPANNGNLYMP